MNPNDLKNLDSKLNEIEWILIITLLIVGGIAVKVFFF